MRLILGYHEHFWSAERRRSFYFGALLLVGALLFQYVAGQHSTRYALKAPFAGDLLLDNLPVVNLDLLIVQGAILLWVGVSILLTFRPHYLIFGMKAIAFFIIVRSVSINLTHIGIYPNQMVLDPSDFGYSLYGLFAFQGNYFFSGHTGLPFLMSLVFWQNRFWRRFFVGVSVLFGASVILAHVHYSIDVFAAPFITYGIFQIAKQIFPKDYALVSMEKS